MTPLALIALTACQRSVSAPELTGSIPRAPAHSLAETINPNEPATVPSCPDHMAAVLTTSLVVHFTGATADDSAICLQEWGGKSYRYYLGFWGDGRFRHGSAEQREALRDVVTAPIGKTVTFGLRKKTRFALWKSAVAQHVANPTLVVGGKHLPTVKIRIVMQDALDRRHVRAERLYWLDRLTGIPLKKQSVVRMANGNVHRFTTWQVASFDPTTLRSSTEDAAGDALE